MATSKHTEIQEPRQGSAKLGVQIGSLCTLGLPITADSILSMSLPAIQCFYYTSNQLKVPLLSLILRQLLILDHIIHFIKY